MRSRRVDPGGLWSSHHDQNLQQQQQAQNNSLAQFSASPDLQNEFVGAVIGSILHGCIRPSANHPQPLDVVANHRGLPTITTQVWAEAQLGWRASIGPRRL